MFYRDLERFAEALNRQDLSKDGKLHDVIYILEHVDDAPRVAVSCEPCGAGVNRVCLSVRSAHGEIVLNFRADHEYLLVLRSYIRQPDHDNSLIVRWCDDYQGFGFPLEAHKRTVYEFVRAVVNGF